jgi:hypothetical protein
MIMSKLFSHRRYTLLAVACGIFSVAAIGLWAHPASAVSADQWRAGRIIDDGIFRNANAMNADQIQAFLNSKVPNCDTSGSQTSEYGGGTRAQFGASRGYPAPYVCLKNYYENINTHANNLQGRPIPAGAMSAAQIIAYFSQKYQINPQVLLTLLQKEQTLITDDWPWANQYQKATGYGCPDTAACDSQYNGFSNQVGWAARMFQAISDNESGWYTPYGKGNSTQFIQWSPTSSCGGSSVSISGRATAALYNYTPYQPNQAALNNLYGTGDGCSSYGNRNFWRLFNDWFGNTLAPEYSWQNYNHVQYAYTDSSKTTPVDLTKLRPGQRVYIGFYVQNTGTITWQNSGANPTRVGAADPDDRSSPFCDSTWIGCNRPSNLREPTVAPGQVGSFEFWYTAPANPGTYMEYFKPLVEGKTWMNDTGMFFYTQVGDRYTWDNINHDQYAFIDSSKTTPIDLTKLQPGQRAYIGFKALNTGNVTWTNSGPNPTRVGVSSPIDQPSPFCDSTWVSCTRPANMTEASVAPGQIGTFEFWYTAPYQGITSLSYFKPLVEGKSWMNDTGMNFYTKVPTPQYSWVNDNNNQYAYTDSSKTTPVDLTNLHPGQRVFIGFKARNTGVATWRNFGFNPTRVGTTMPIDRVSSFCDSTWLGCGRPANMIEPTIYPGQVGTFEFWYKAPATIGTYREYFKPMIEGVNWTNDTGMHFYTVVK